MSAAADFDQVLADAEGLRAKLMAEKRQLLQRIDEIDEQVGRLYAFAHPNAIVVTPEAQRAYVAPERVGRRGQPLNARDLMHAVAMWYGTTVSALVARDRHGSLAQARHVAVWVVRRFTNPRMSFPEIGRAFGGRDHTTCIASCDKVDAMRTADSEFDAEMSELEGLIRQAEMLRQPPPLLLAAEDQRQSSTAEYTGSGGRGGREAGDGHSGSSGGVGGAPAAALEECAGTGAGAAAHPGGEQPGACH